MRFPCHREEKLRSLVASKFCASHVRIDGVLAICMPDGHQIPSCARALGDVTAAKTSSVLWPRDRFYPKFSQFPTLEVDAMTSQSPEAAMIATVMLAAVSNVLEVPGDLSHTLTLECLSKTNRLARKKKRKRMGERISLRMR